MVVRPGGGGCEVPVGRLPFGQPSDERLVGALVLPTVSVGAVTHGACLTVPADGLLPH
jgi:hypothetical protein